MNALLHQVESQSKRHRKKVKNILVRYGGCKEVRGDCLEDKSYHHPENAFLLKYFPKYYQCLALQMKRQDPLLSKIKRIKKLKRFTGRFFGQIPQPQWFKILGDKRKEIEEFPIVLSSQAQSLFWEQTSLYAVKFFFHIKKLHLPTFRPGRFSPDDFLAVWEPFSKHLRNMRKLKILEIYTERYFAIGVDSNVLNPLLQKLNGMPRLLSKLEVFKSPFRSDALDEILQKSALSYVTNLAYISVSSVISPFCQAIPQVCKNLKSFSLEHMQIGLLRNPRSRDLIVPIHEFSKLQSISINCSGSWSSNSWFSLIPPASLRRLNLGFEARDMVDMRLECENFFEHWKEMVELDVLELRICCGSGYEILFTRNFITALLKKVSRLASFQCKIDLREEGVWRYEPFLIGKIPHLYEYLKKFQVRIGFSEDCVIFDFGFLKPFKNLKEIDLQGYDCSWVNIADAVRLLEENMKDGEFSTLKLERMDINYKDESKKLWKKISRERKGKTCLKIVLALQFKIQAGDDEIVYLDQFCEIIGAKPVKGLEVSLDMRYQDYSDCDIGKVKRVLGKYPELKNFVLRIHYKQTILEFIRRDGEIDQLLFYPEDN